MEVLLVALDASMTRWYVGRRRSNPLVLFSASHWTAMTGRSASAVFSLATTSLKMPVRPVWSRGNGLGGMERLVSAHLHKQTRVHLSARRKSGAAVNSVDLTATD